MCILPQLGKKKGELAILSAKKKKRKEGGGRGRRKLIPLQNELKSAERN